MRPFGTELLIYSCQTRDAVDPWALACIHASRQMECARKAAQGRVRSENGMLAHGVIPHRAPNSRSPLLRERCHLSSVALRGINSCTTARNGRGVPGDSPWRCSQIRTRASSQTTATCCTFHTVRCRFVSKQTRTRSPPVAFTQSCAAS